LLESVLLEEIIGDRSADGCVDEVLLETDEVVVSLMLSGLVSFTVCFSVRFFVVFCFFCFPNDVGRKAIRASIESSAMLSFPLCDWKIVGDPK